MKRTKWFALTLVLATAAMFASACGGPNETGGGSGNQSGGSGSGGGNTQGGGAKGDEYVDYLPEKTPGGDQFDFDGNYEAPELTIDGKGDDAQWQAAPELTTFGKKVDGEDAVTVKAYRGDSALFFLFDVKDTVLLTEGETNDDAVTRSDSIEFYLDTLADGGVRPQSDDYQINLGIHGKTRIMQGAGGQWGNWNGLIDYEVDLNGTLNDNAEATDIGYTVEVMVPYSQIMIEKEDTIAISFGQVDKFGTGASVNTDWNWYGWDWGGTLREPQTINNYVLYDKNGTLTDRDEQPRPAADMAGYVTDIETGKPVVGATASVTVGDREESATTDADGYFIFEKVDSDGRYEVTVRANGYLDGSLTYERSELRAVNGGRVLKTLALTPTANLETTTLSGTVKNIVEGAVEGATVAVSGTTIKATSGEGGAFTISDVPANMGSITLLVTKTGYGDSELTIPEEQLEVGGTTALGDVNINLPWGDAQYFATGAGKDATKVPLFANFHAQIARTLTGVMFKFDGERKMTPGKIELYLDTKECANSRENDATCWRFDLNENGTVDGSHFAGGEFSAAGLEYKLISNGDDGCHITFLIPYTYLGISGLETFGVSFGQWSETASDWDGWAYNGTFVAPETPETYRRVGARNNIYIASNNLTMVALSGNVGQGNVTVKVGSSTTTTNGSGDWSLNVPLSGAITVTYSKQGYVTKTTEIGEDYFNDHLEWSEKITLEEQHVTITGKVTDQSGAAIKDVDVQITDGDKLNITVQTDGQGEYTLENVTTFGNATITFSKEGYTSGTTSFTAQQLSEQATHRADKQITALSLVKKITVSGKIVGIEGGIEGAKVSYGEDEFVTTGAGGSFTIPEFESKDSTLTVTKEGYRTATVTFTASEVGADESSYNFPDAFLTREYTALGDAFGIKADTFAHFTPYLTRGETAFEFRFVGTKVFNGHIELFVDTKEGGTVAEGRNSNDYRFNLVSDGTVSIENFGGNNTDTSTLTLKVNGADTETPEVLFTLPYAFLKVERNEIIGVTFGQWSNSASDWDGWEHPDLKGVNGLAFVAPEITMDYIRVGLDNKPFESVENALLSEIDVSEYNMHFGTGLDPFHAKLSRDSTGVTFDFITTADFGVSRNVPRGIDNSTEVVLVYLDIGEAKAGWQNDFILKIDSAGNVYLKGGAWWPCNQESKIGTVQINRDGGITTFSYKLEYTKFGCGADQVFGITMVEGWLTDADQAAARDNYGAFLVRLENNHHIAGDAADEATFIRVKADGTLVTAGSNAEVK